ncbi:hypothetical protein SAMN05216389_10141 [Oceanobacillus limi]|uniref:Uncharacterized protein n=1 Tax=Oceanobacillus limi TaxID=930131 RepID=A0A1H9Y0T1_9BACI|nr:hypothetical protein [Oceanobacillus limi]SES61820.1 hypothetical protein SAMN05216389_10141 [Oceanobacillus limi]
MKRQTKIHIIGWILGSILGFLKWQYPEESSIITSGLGGLIAVMIVCYLIIYEPKKKS